MKLIAILALFATLQICGCQTSTTRDPLTGQNVTTTSVNFTAKDVKNVVRLLRETTGGVSEKPTRNIQPWEA